MTIIFIFVWKFFFQHTFILKRYLFIFCLFVIDFYNDINVEKIQNEGTKKDKRKNNIKNYNIRPFYIFLG